MKNNLLLLFFLLLGSWVSALAVPPLVNYAGRVAVKGQPFEGTGQLKFALVNASGNPTYWSNDGTSVNGSEPTAHVSVQVNGGLYSILLGNTAITGMSALDVSVFRTHSDIKLRVWFNDGKNGFQQLSPDRPFSSVPYALSAGSLSSTSTSQIKGTFHNPYGWDGEVIEGRKYGSYTVPEGKVLIIISGTPLADGKRFKSGWNHQGILPAGTVVSYGDQNNTVFDSAIGEHLTQRTFVSGLFTGVLVNEIPSIEPFVASIVHNNYSTKFEIPSNKLLVVFSTDDFGNLYYSDDENNPIISNAQSVPAIYSGGATGKTIICKGSASRVFRSSFSGYLISPEEFKKLR